MEMFWNRENAGKLLINKNMTILLISKTSFSAGQAFSTETSTCGDASVVECDGRPMTTPPPAPDSNYWKSVK